MIQQAIKKGFTLIELLVVITIIGILAVGGTQVYTKQIQKARDSTRITGSQTVKSGLDQFMLAKSSYPKYSELGSLSGFIDDIPTDPKTQQSCFGGTPCDFLYAVGVDNNSVNEGAYELSIGFEASASIESQAKSDVTGTGKDDLRYEVGNGKDSTTITTNVNPGTNKIVTTITCGEETLNNVSLGVITGACN